MSMAVFFFAERDTKQREMVLLSEFMVFMLSFLSLPVPLARGVQPTYPFRLPEHDLLLASQVPDVDRIRRLTEVCHGDAKGANILYTNDGGTGHRFAKPQPWDPRRVPLTSRA